MCMENRTGFVQGKKGLNPSLLHLECPKSHHWCLPMARGCSGQVHGLQREITVLAGTGSCQQPQGLWSQLWAQIQPQNRSSAASKQGDGESRWGQADSSDSQPWGQGSDVWPQPHFKAEGLLCKGSSPHGRTGCANSVKQSQTAKTWPWACSDEFKSAWGFSLTRLLICS